MSSEPINLSGRTVVITGGARGIGLATAKALTAVGARVAIGDLDGEKVAQSAQEVGAGTVAGVLDVTQPDSFAEFLALAGRELGHIDVLINNAGIMPIGPFLEETDDVQRRVLDINVGGVMTGMKLALPDMLARGSGHVVNVSSIAGRSTVPGGATYAASKAAIVSLTETARVEFAGRGVDFTCVMPSFTDTELISGMSGTKFIPTASPDDVAAGIVKAIAKRKKDVFVPAVIGVMARTQPLMGRKLRDLGNHLIGADAAFTVFDKQARSGYTERVTGAGDATAAESPSESASAETPAS